MPYLRMQQTAKGELTQRGSNKLSVFSRWNRKISWQLHAFSYATPITTDPDIELYNAYTFSELLDFNT